MNLVRPIFALPLLLSLLAMQGGGRYQGFGRQRDYYSEGPNVPSEFYWTRLQYTSGYANGTTYGYSRRTPWMQDFPKADNDCLIALRRLTHINSPSPLNVSDLDSD